MSELNPVEPTEDLLPEDFRSFLSSHYGTPPAVKAGVDEEILRQAKQQLVAKTDSSVAKSSSGAGPRFGVFWRYAAVLSTVVAVCVLITLGLNQVRDTVDGSGAIATSSKESESMVAASRVTTSTDALVASRHVVEGDEDGSGKVNILDAFAVARMIRDGRNQDLRSDMNGDGRVDDQDVDLIAYKAVAL